MRDDLDSTHAGIHFATWRHWQNLTRHDQELLKCGVPDVFADLELSTEDAARMSIN